MKIFSGTSHPEYARELASFLGLKLEDLEIACFSDGECRVRLTEDVRNEKILLVQTLGKEVNSLIFETLLILRLLKENGADRIFGVFPYLAYSRQNKAHRPGEAVSAAVLADLFCGEGLNGLLTCDVHSDAVLPFYGQSAVNVSVLPLLVNAALADFSGGDYILVSPDQDGAHRVKLTAEKLNLPWTLIEKERDLNKIDELKAIHGKKLQDSVNGKIVILLDDMIAAGSTMIAATKAVIEGGAQKVIACATHGVFGKNPRTAFAGTPLEAVYVSDSLVQGQEINFPGLKIVKTAQYAAPEIEKWLKTAGAY